MPNKKIVARKTKPKPKQKQKQKQKQAVKVQVHIDQSRKNEASKQPIIISGGGSNNIPYPMPMYTPPPLGMQDIKDMIKSTIHETIPKYQMVGNEMSNPYGFQSPQDKTKSPIVNSLDKTNDLSIAIPKRNNPNSVVFVTDDSIASEDSDFPPAFVKFSKPVSRMKPLPTPTDDEISGIFGLGPQDIDLENDITFSKPLTPLTPLAGGTKETPNSKRTRRTKQEIRTQLETDYTAVTGDLAKPSMSNKYLNAGIVASKAGIKTRKRVDKIMGSP